MYLSKTAAKFILVLINMAIFIISYISLVLLTYVIIVDEPEWEISKYTRLLILLLWITVVVLMVSTSFFGCWAVLMENRLFLKMYWMILMGLLALQLIQLTAILYFVPTDNHQYTRVKLETRLNEYQSNEQSRNMMDGIQMKYNCCGIESYNEWQAVIGYIPSSCCENKSMFDPCTKEDVNGKRGCLTYVADEQNEPCTIFLYHVISTSAILFIALIAVSIVQQSVMKSTSISNLQRRI